MEYKVVYDRVSKDWSVSVDGELVGFRRSYGEAYELATGMLYLVARDRWPVRPGKETVDECDRDTAA